MGAYSKCSVDKKIRCIYIVQVSSFASSRVIVGTCADTYQIPKSHSSSRRCKQVKSFKLLTNLDFYFFKNVTSPNHS